MLLDAPVVNLAGSVSATGGLGGSAGADSGFGGSGGPGTVGLVAGCLQRSGHISPDPQRDTTTRPATTLAGDDAYGTEEDAGLAVTVPGVLGNDCGPADLQATLVTPAEHGVVTLGTDGSFTYEPAANYHGPDAFTYDAQAPGVASTSATVTLTVAPANDVPVAVGDAYRTTAGTILNVGGDTGVLANDADADGDVLTGELVEPTTIGSLTLAGDGSFSYEAPAGSSGMDSFTYRVSDATGASATATVSLTIEAAGPTLVATVLPPVNQDGSSTFTARRGVVPLRFDLQRGGVASCQLPPATLQLVRLGGTDSDPVDEAVFGGPADSGSSFRIVDCTYHYNVTVKALGVGSYRTAIVVDGSVIGTVTFALR